MPQVRGCQSATQASNSPSASPARPCASRKRPRAAGISTLPTPAAEAARVGKLRFREFAGAAHIAKREQRLRCARTRVNVAGVTHLHTPDLRLPERHAGFEFPERLLRASLRQPQASARCRNQHGSDAGRQALMGQEIKQRLGFIELAAGDRDLCEYRRAERQSLREVSVLRDTQRDARGGVGLRQIAKLELQKRSRAVDRDEAARTAGTVGLLTQRHKRGFYYAESLRRQEAPQERGAHIPAFRVSARTSQRRLQRSGRFVRWPPGQNGDHPLRDGQGARRSSRELAARQAFHHAQGARRRAGVLQTYGD